ncbi:uncharacterized protein LACBIDRAFT_329376 [Laccaria bicolor S238N-H82]|uniref:Predicted protein n=1 Tax=Laccaria bicolor (strain S238N-H82 / ATCC MYA-4686) TaxID=486041 RepID=B0DHU7_LACBS|nr:uncharacterized protein LACBIDRAFT_329376 [Laccaria bicolor S238N-H82]EDR05792.1 predicted protein [Laccaria bicolor S238N-H82]|eukprot:XP_001883468.1 predicted protein [Laccaria bicolor S238N-H82]
MFESSQERLTSSPSYAPEGPSDSFPPDFEINMDRQRKRSRSKGVHRSMKGASGDEARSGELGSYNSAAYLIIVGVDVSRMSFLRCINWTLDGRYQRRFQQVFSFKFATFDIRLESSRSRIFLAPQRVQLAQLATQMVSQRG